MTKNESKLLSLQGIAKASAFCLLLSAFSVNAAMAAPAGTVDEVMAVQQGKKVTGVVIDGTGEPVIGANVVVKGTTNGTITDFDGNYTIEGVSANDVLVISYIGYLSQEVPVGNQSMIKVTLKEDTQTLDEVVVVGYGTMKKSDVTGSISTAKGDDLVKNQSFSALDNLRGKVSGVNIFSNSSQPGAYSNRVVIRGIATINSSSNPLYVVDGVVMENFDLVNPNDIESMEVLKDASAAAIYGARGANGVIMVTTKRGKKDGEGVAISYQGSVSVSSIARKMDLLNAQEWTDTFMKGLENENKWLGTNWSLNRTDWFTDRNYFDANGNPIYDTDWQDEATRTAVSHNHQLNIQQAGKNSSMGAFLNYTDQQGIMLNTYNKRLNAKMAYDADPTKWLSTSVNVLVNHTWGRYTPEDGGGQEARRTMIEMLPWLPVYEPGTNKYTTSTSPSLSGFNLEGMSNPVFILNDQRRMKYNTQIFGNAALTFHLAEGLDLKTQFGLDSHNITYRGYSSVGLNNISMPNGWAEYENWNTLYWQEETYLTYNKVLGDHRINAMAGLSWQERTYRRNKSKTEGFSDDFYEDYNMIVGTTPKSPESDWTRWAMNSYFLRFAYTYKDRYSATVTGRIDGSSKFGDNNKYAFFPSAGLAWNVSQEDFLKDSNLISNLKLHTSYGLTGNSEIDPYKSLGKIKSETLLLNGTRAPYSYMETMPNPDLKWEKTGQFDVGFTHDPIYDWKTQDIWIANGKFGWTYNHLYDLYYQAGVPLSRQRVASPFISQAISTLFIYKVVDPDMWGRMVGRVNGVGFAGIYGNTSAMGWRAIKCPAGFSWEKYMYFLLNTLPEETRENYLNKLRVSRKFWREKGGCLSEETIAKLRAANIPIIVEECTAYHTDKKPVRMEYIDDINIPEFKEIPTYKRMCVCILKNDHTCKYMGFSQTKRERDMRKEVMDKYNFYKHGKLC